MLNIPLKWIHSKVYWYNRNFQHVVHDLCRINLRYQLSAPAGDSKLWRDKNKTAMKAVSNGQTDVFAGNQPCSKIWWTKINDRLHPEITDSFVKHHYTLGLLDSSSEHFHSFHILSLSTWRIEHHDIYIFLLDWLGSFKGIWKFGGGLDLLHCPFFVQCSHTVKKGTYQLVVSETGG